MRRLGLTLCVRMVVVVVGCGLYWCECYSSLVVCLSRVFFLRINTRSQEHFKAGALPTQHPRRFLRTQM